MLTVGNRVMWDAKLQGTIILYEQDGNRDYIRVKLDNDHTVTTIRQSMWGIPITPELLERCGFVDTGQGEFISRMRVSIYMYGRFEYVGAINIGLGKYMLLNKVKHLHELQNLIHALTGKQLEIK